MLGLNDFRATFLERLRTQRKRNIGGSATVMIEMMIKTIMRIEN